MECINNIILISNIVFILICLTLKINIESLGNIFQYNKNICHLTNSKVLYKTFELTNSISNR